MLESLPPLERIRRFFELTEESYGREGYLGCLLGGLGQELSGTNDVFRQKIKGCLAEISGRTARCLEEAKQVGDLPAESNPQEMADLLVDCWEGAALRSRLRGDPAPLAAMLDFYFHSCGQRLSRDLGRGGTPEVEEASPEEASRD